MDLYDVDGPKAEAALVSCLDARGIRYTLRDCTNQGNLLASATLARSVQVWCLPDGWYVTCVRGSRATFSTAHEAVEHARSVLVAWRDDARKALGEYLAP